ncbi:hypothetical protein GCM10011512_02260 [Tersicoccus solisilvae]|uniref:SnoaL-like domain-containing protein n=1 Tax=Tersicoccus solisilvae TaxID=1882339 RepID=A0ABQ1NL24_9MICC|nr:nuclear transport factor 2 family protein [Tersicoccus solisilvae]GGC79151.1 hypothetical protein GCM10011512_02260 [Tersicoccus solisilvae]
MTTSDAGARYVRALARKDRAALAAVLAPDVDFRAMTPRRFWEADRAEDVLDVLLGHWFEDGDHITAVLGTSEDDVVDRHRISYRMTVRNDGGDHLVEQTAYYDVDGDRISLLRVICSGFVPTGT